MGSEKIVKIAFALVMAAASTGQVPQLMKTIYTFQVRVLYESRSINWGSPMEIRAGSKNRCIHQ
jgi:hypothetical protein